MAPPTKKFKRKSKTSAFGGLSTTQRKQVNAIISKTANIGIHDVVADDADVPWNAAPVELTLIAEGTKDTERDGQQIQPTSLQWRINTRLGASQMVTSTVRFIIFRWMKDSAPAANSLLTLSGGITAPISPLNVTSNKGEYSILHDSSFICSAQSASPMFHRVFKKFMKLNGKVIYSGAATTSGIKGRLYYQFISDVTSNGPRIMSAFRLRYTK